MVKYSVVVACALLAAGCASLAPHYQRPAAPVPESWPTGAAYAAPHAPDAPSAPATDMPTQSQPQTQPQAPTQPANASPARIPWQQFIKDDKLRQVVSLALTNSRDLRKSLAAIASARAQYGEQRADLFPHITADASMTKTRSLNTYTGSGNSTITSETDSATIGVTSFEIDLFGKERSLTRAAYETYLSSAEAARATQITLVGDTITYYLTLAADRSTLTIARNTLQSAQRSMDLTRSRLNAGVASLVDVKQAETVYQQARADVASLTSSIAQDRNALELVVGASVPDTLLPDDLPQEGQGWLTEVPAGVSSQILLDRPDVLEAEHNLKSANANIGAARAAFFPSITLTASDGRGSTSLSSLFKGPNVWTFAPSIDLPLFSGGANMASLRYSKAQRDSYVAAYELAIQTAFKEVADALAVRGTIYEQLDSQQALVDAAAESYKLADARYSKGADTFLNALDSQRTLYSAQKTLVSTRLTAAENLVTLYRVLGGGA